MFIAMLHQVEKFVKTCRSPRTAEGYRAVLEKLAGWLDDHSITFDQITPEAFMKFLGDQSQWGAVSRYLAYNVTRSFLRWRIGEDHPLSTLRMKRPRSKPQPVITQEQFDKLLVFFDQSTPIGSRDLSLFALAAETGLRASALCNLKMRDLHLDSLTLVVLDKGLNGGNWRICKFSAVTANFLSVWLAYRAGIAKPETDTVFCSVYGVKRGLSNNRFGLLSRCREISRKVGFHFTPHVFRRFMATRMLELKASNSAVMKQGGWTSETEFRKYIQTYQLQDVEPYSPVVEFFRKE